MKTPTPTSAELTIRQASALEIAIDQANSKSQLEQEPTHPALRAELERPTWQKAVLFSGASALLYGFLINLSLVGIGFKLLGGKDSANMFDDVGNPFSAMMVGILATVLVQSSSTSTSLIIALVGAGMLSPSIAIPMVMGANIGTTVTNTLMSLAYFKSPEEYSRGFAAATVHDIFNFLTVAILLPLQWGTNFLSDMTWEMAKDQQPCEGSCSKWKGPVKLFVDPVTSLIAQYDKKVAKAISLNKCSIKDGINPCTKPLLKGGKFYELGLSDNTAGAICVSVSIPLLCVCLVLLVKILKKLLRGRARELFQKAVNINPYLSMLIGCGMTILVQSSSVTTSVLTPLCAMDAIKLEQMFPLTLGANVGTTVTGLLAASVATSNPAEALQVALSHLFFNLFGIMIWFPNEKLRKIPLNSAKKLGELAGKHKTMPFFYTAGAFVGLPAACYGISKAF